LGAAVFLHNSVFSQDAVFLQNDDIPAGH